MSVPPTGKAATEDQTPPDQCSSCCKKHTANQCMMCCKNVSVSEIVSCEKCFCGKYCSKNCMEKHENHAHYCSIICDLQNLETEKRMKNEIFVQDSEKLPYKMKLQLIRLVGERPIVKIHLNG